ncbi:MAG: SEC-C metal-binding domain-containing protein [Bryobacteraceae bacterium]
METPGRNAPCWCGSGRKYKKCHLNADVEQRANCDTPPIPRARDYFDLQRSILTPEQLRSDEAGPPRSQK